LVFGQPTLGCPDLEVRHSSTQSARQRPEQLPLGLGAASGQANLCKARGLTSSLHTSHHA
jgi:hypothetical protein